MPMTLCSKCGAIHPGRGKCADCKTIDNKHRELARGERYGREGYATRAYRTNRVVVLAQAECCDICGGWPTETNPLTCDHIDGNPNNNKISNLRAACMRCNSGKRGRET